jgi:hypothetical protein
MASAEDRPIPRPIERPRHHDPGFDPEFDSHRPWRTPPRRILFPEEYQRLVANPFLALVGLMVGVAGLRQAVAARALPLLVMGLIVVAGSVALLHYHCLDCGRTGWIFRWRRHACDRVVERQRAGTVRRFRGPNPTLQLVVWAYILLGLAFLGVVVLRGPW